MTAHKTKPAIKPVARAVFASTMPGSLEPYVPGDKLPLPEVLEKDSDSVWELWSDAVKGEQPNNPAGNAATAEKDMETQPATLLMGLPELPGEPDR